MCGRFTLTKTQKFESIPPEQRLASFNVAPSNQIIILDPEPMLKTWSYSPLWAKKPFHLINCRSETMHQKPSFKGAMRCLIPTTGWYEWQDNGTHKQPIIIILITIYFILRDWLTIKAVLSLLKKLIKI